MRLVCNDVDPKSLAAQSSWAPRHEENGGLVHDTKGFSVTLCSDATENNRKSSKTVSEPEAREVALWLTMRKGSERHASMALL